MNSRAHPVSDYPDHRAWAEMLAGFVEKNARLSDFVASRRPVRSGPSLLRELERERSRIARELHAGAGQPLAGIKLHLEILNECTAAIPDSAWGNRLQGEDCAGRPWTPSNLGGAGAESSTCYFSQTSSAGLARNGSKGCHGILGGIERSEREHPPKAGFSVHPRGTLARRQGAALSLCPRVYLQHYPTFRGNRGDRRSGCGRRASPFNRQRQWTRIRRQREKFRHWIESDQ